MVTVEMHNWIINNVLGTCDVGYVYEENFNKEFGLTEDSGMFDKALDDAEVFLCEDCGCYYEISDHSDAENIIGSVCSDCHPSDEE